VLALALLLCAALSLGAQTTAERSIRITLLQVNVFPEN
jgi:hypothetical protein